VKEQLIDTRIILLPQPQIVSLHAIEQQTLLGVPSG